MSQGKEAWWTTPIIHNWNVYTYYTNERVRELACSLARGTYQARLLAGTAAWRPRSKNARKRMSRENLVSRLRANGVHVYFEQLIRGPRWKRTFAIIGGNPGNSRDTVESLAQEVLRVHGDPS